MTVFLSVSIKKVRYLQYKGRLTRDSEVWGSGRMVLAVVHQDDIGGFTEGDLSPSWLESLT